MRLINVAMSAAMAAMFASTIVLAVEVGKASVRAPIVIRAHASTAPMAVAKPTASVLVVARR